METAFCQICGKAWDAQDPGVRYVHGDGRWECTDEVACFDRRSMQRGLAGAWALLDAVSEALDLPLGVLPPGVELPEDAIRALEHAFGQMPPARPGK